MPRHCTTCDHAERDQIDRALVAGDSYRIIAGRFNLSLAALSRHRADHLPAHLARAHAAEQAAAADDLLDELRDLHRRTLALLEKAEQAGDLRVALSAIREARGNLELLAKLSGELDERAQINVMMSPEWVQLRAIILTALAPYPDARQVVAAQLLRLEGP